jgi:hypothetical protein
VNVFVSRPTWIGKTFEAGLDAFIRVLKSHDLTPRTLGATDYPSKSPLDEVIGLMEQCSGAVILGYPQILVRAGTFKDEDIAEVFSLPTEWNHIEAALAYARGLPLLVIHHLAIDRGIFDRGAVSAFLHKTDLTMEGWPLEPAIHGALQKWKNDCLRNPIRDNPGIAAPPAISTPSCPNCSAGGPRFFLRPIPKPFSEIAGGAWECSKCGYVA